MQKLQQEFRSQIGKAMVAAFACPPSCVCAAAMTASRTRRENGKVSMESCQTKGLRGCKDANETGTPVRLRPKRKAEGNYLYPLAQVSHKWMVLCRDHHSRWLPGHSCRL